MEKVELPMKLKLRKELRYQQGTYHIIGNFIIRVNHVAVHMGRYPKQMLLPFFPPMFV